MVHATRKQTLHGTAPAFRPSSGRTGTHTHKRMPNGIVQGFTRLERNIAPAPISCSGPLIKLRAPAVRAVARPRTARRSRCRTRSTGRRAARKKRARPGGRGGTTDPGSCPCRRSTASEDGSSGFGVGLGQCVRDKRVAQVACEGLAAVRRWAWGGRVGDARHLGLTTAGTRGARSMAGGRRDVCYYTM